jgi:hypothetical protein
MPETIKTGTILIKENTVLPKTLQLESEPCASGWRLVKNLDGYGLARKIHDAGWTFFYLAGEIKATAFGFDRQKTARRAAKRILANLKSEKFNSLEITRAASKRFLGVPYASVSAHSRHIQESALLFRAKNLPFRSGTLQDWLPLEPKHRARKGTALGRNDHTAKSDDDFESLSS